MNRLYIVCLCVILFAVTGARAEDVDEVAAPDTKELSGMAIVGNDEAPKSLYIVPWKSSDLGVEARLDMTFDESDAPVDPEAFNRKLEFYEVSTER